MSSAPAASTSVTLLPVRRPPSHAAKASVQRAMRGHRKARKAGSAKESAKAASLRRSRSAAAPSGRGPSGWAFTKSLITPWQPVP